MSIIADDTLSAKPHAIRDEMIVFIVMAALPGLMPFTGIYPFFVMQALCFALLACAFNLLIGYGCLLSFGHAMFLGTAGYRSAHALKVWGVSPELGFWLGCRRRGAFGGDGIHLNPEAGNLLLDDHAGVVAASVLPLPAGAIYPW